MRKYPMAIATWLMLVWVGNAAMAQQQESTSEGAVVTETVERVIPDDHLVVVVMDPLCSRLACDCVQGYAQRDYEKLAAFVAAKNETGVSVVYGESLESALKESGGRADLVIGKHSVVVAESTAADLGLEPVLQLTGKDNSVSQTGLIVVRAENPAMIVEDLQGYRIFFGPSSCDEKYSAPMALLREHGVTVPEDPSQVETCGACSEAASDLMELPADAKAAAVISSYAAPLLEGCGNIRKGDLRVVGESKPVAFITVFANASMKSSLREKVTSALLDVELDPAMLTALETASGFVPWSSGDAAAHSASPVESAGKKN